MSARFGPALVLALLLGGAVPGGAQQPLPGGERSRNRAATAFAPFADLERGRWGLAITGRAVAANNALSIFDAQALRVLGDHDSLRASDAANAIGLVPDGQGLELNADAAWRVFLGGPLGQRLALGLSAGVRGYGRGTLDSSVVAFLRDGTEAHPDLRLGTTQGVVVSVLEYGAHATWRMRGGPRAGGGLTIGLGARLQQTIYHARGGSAVAPNVARVTGDSVSADVAVQTLRSLEELPGGGALAWDAYLGYDLPHHALEVWVGFGGTLEAERNERRTARFFVKTTTLEEVSDSLDAVEFDVRDTVAATVRLPTLIRVRALLWLDRWIGAELGVSAATGGPFAAPALFDGAAVLRLIPGVPITAGVELGGGTLPAYFLKTGLVTTHFQLEFGATGLGTIGDEARGVGGLVRLGVFF